MCGRQNPTVYNFYKDNINEVIQKAFLDIKFLVSKYIFGCDVYVFFTMLHKCWWNLSSYTT